MTNPSSILVVDDNKLNRKILKDILIMYGHTPVLAENGIEALDKLKGESIDMIISDILMPGMDGFQLCRKCKGDDMLKKIPFVFYTATYKDRKDEEFALSLGS